MVFEPTGKTNFLFFSGYLQNTSLRLVPDVSSHPCNTFSMYQRGVSHRVSVKAQRVFSQDFEHPKRSSIVFRVLVPSKDPLFTKETHISEVSFSSFSELFSPLKFITNWNKCISEVYLYQAAMGLCTSKTKFQFWLQFYVRTKANYLHLDNWFFYSVRFQNGYTDDW